MDRFRALVYLVLQDCRNVLLVFSVRESGRFQGERLTITVGYHYLYSLREREDGSKVIHYHCWLSLQPGIMTVKRLSVAEWTL